MRSEVRPSADVSETLTDERYETTTAPMTSTRATASKATLRKADDMRDSTDAREDTGYSAVRNPARLKHLTRPPPARHHRPLGGKPYEQCRKQRHHRTGASRS